MLELPVLDNKRYQQILAEAIARIPTLTDQWTDYNPQDTGIMLLELLAAMTELQNFYLDQVGNRFYDKYLALVTEPIDGESTAQQSHRFARQCALPDVAVTPADYERIVMALPLPLKKVQAQYVNGFLTLTVLGKAPPLREAELTELRCLLEPYRLLTTRIKIQQAAYLPLDIFCRLSLNFALGRASICREKLAQLFYRMVEKKEEGAVLNLSFIRSQILSMPEITQIDALSICIDGKEQNQIFSQENTFMAVNSIQIEFSNKRGFE